MHALKVVCIAIFLSLISIVDGFREFIGNKTKSYAGLKLDKELQTIQDNINVQIYNAQLAANGSLIYTHHPLESYSNNYSLTYNISETEFFEFQENVTISLLFKYKTDKPIVVSFDAKADFVGEIRAPMWQRLESTNDHLKSKNFTIPLKPLYFGKLYLYMWVRNDSNAGLNESDNHEVKTVNGSLSMSDYWKLIGDSEKHSDAMFGIKLIVNRQIGIVSIVFKVSLLILIIVITFFLGCDLDIAIIIEIMKKPIGPLIGFVGQYVIMPISSFCIGYFIPISSEFGFGLLTLGCCPGGLGSNIWCLLLGGDINLSMTMTFISNVAAIGMLPLLLFIFGRFFIDQRFLKIPYANIILQIFLFVLPISFSMLLKWKRPKIAQKFAKQSKKLALFFLIYVFTFGTYVNLSVLRQMGFYAILIPIGALLPYVSFCLSTLLAYVCCQSRARILTIGIETSIQNIGLGLYILLYSMPKPDGELAAVMVYIISIFTPAPFYIILAVIHIKKCLKRRNEDGEKQEVTLIKYN